jgi:hypothetical protein
MKTLAVIVLSLFACVGLVALIPEGQATVSQLIAAFTLPLNTNPPAYLKDLVAYKEGDGLVVYLTLADASGAFTSADGTLTLTIREHVREPWMTSERTVTLWTNTYGMTRTQFVTGQVGLGNFARTKLLLSLGRIGSQNFYVARQTNHVTVEVTILTQGLRLTGTQEVWL